MALIPFSNPNIDRIIDRDYEAFTDKLFDEAYGDHGERCYNCEHFVSAYKDTPCYCNKDDIEDTEDDDEFKQLVEENTVDPDDCCDDWQPDVSFFDELEDDI